MNAVKDKALALDSTLQSLHTGEFSFEQFKALVFSMFIAAILSYALALYYTRYGKSLSNRALLAKDFVLITLTTALVITIVKASLALSLGLVGALSIVRFRAAIKEPEELAYLFLTIGIGLGCGADQWIATVIAFVIILCFLHLRTFFQTGEADHNLFVNVDVENKNHPDLLDRFVHIFQKRAEVVDLRRVDARGNALQTTFLVQLKRGSAIQEIIAEIQKLQPTAVVTFVDQSRRADL